MLWLYLILLPMRFNSICLTLNELPIRYGYSKWPISFIQITEIPFSSPFSLQIVSTSWSKDGRLNTSFINGRSLSSSLLSSSVSLIRESRWSAATLAFILLESTSSLSSGWLLHISSSPIIPFNGVRISWDILARKSDLLWFALFSLSSSIVFSTNSCLSKIRFQCSISPSGLQIFRPWSSIYL